MDRKRTTEIAYLLLRIVAGFLVIQTGSDLLFSWSGGVQPEERIRLLSQAGIGGVLQLVGGILILLGVFTRPVAFILSGMMAVAYWQFHFPHGRWPVQNQGMPAVLFCFIFLYMAARGNGQFSLAALLRSKAHA
jgi:putative oxidoreductase